VLIAVHSYVADSGLNQLPAVAHNAAALRAALCDESVWGLAQTACQVLSSDVGPGTVIRAIDSAVREATDTLLIYYAGHGLLHPDRPTELHLALHDSNEHQMWRSLPYAYIRDEVRAVHRRRLKCAVVLDCCFSGAAVEGGMGLSNALLSKVTDIDGVCVLTSSAATELAWSPPAQSLSAFTGALLKLVRDGVVGAGPVLDFGTLHAELRHTMTSGERQQHPQLGAHNSGERIAVFRNPAHRPETPTAGRSGRVPSPHNDRSANAVRERLAAELHARAQDIATSTRCPEHRGRQLMTLAHQALTARLTEDAVAFQRAAAVCLAEAGDALLGDCLIEESALLLYAGQPSLAAGRALEAARLMTSQGDTEGAAHARLTAAEALRKSGTLPEADQQVQEALRCLVGADDLDLLSYAHRLAAKIAFAQGDRDTARRLLQEAHQYDLDSGAKDGPSTRAITHPSKTTGASLANMPYPVLQRP
jgi:hypothetical protein